MLWIFLFIGNVEVNLHVVEFLTPLLIIKKILIVILNNLYIIYFLIFMIFLNIYTFTSLNGSNAFLFLRNLLVAITAVGYQ